MVCFLAHPFFVRVCCGLSMPLLLFELSLWVLNQTKERNTSMPLLVLTLFLSPTANILDLCTDTPSLLPYGA